MGNIIVFTLQLPLEIHVQSTLSQYSVQPIIHKDWGSEATIAKIQRFSYSLWSMKEEVGYTILLWLVMATSLN